MSNVSFSFGSVLQGDFVHNNGVYVYATVFARGGQVGTPLELVTDGHLNSALTINNLNSLTSGNIVVTMQETAGTTITPFNPTGLAFNQVASATSACPVDAPRTLGRKPRVWPLADNSIGMPNCTMLVRSAASPDAPVAPVMVNSIVS